MAGGRGVNVPESLFPSPSNPDTTASPSPPLPPPPPPPPTLTPDQVELLKKAQEAELRCIEAEQQRLEAQKAAVQARTSAVEAFSAAIEAGLAHSIPPSIINAPSSSLTQPQLHSEQPRPGKGKHLNASDMVIIDGPPADFHTIPRQIIDDAASRHEIPLDALTRESLRAFNLHTKKIPESFNPKGEANIAPKIKWDFSSEASLTYADSLEALDNYIHLLTNAGYPSEVINMFADYINDMRNVSDAQSIWPAILETFIHARAMYFSYQNRIKFDSTSHDFQARATEMRTRGILHDLLKANNIQGTYSSGSGAPGPSRSYKENPRRGQTPYDRQPNFPSSRRPFQFGGNLVSGDVSCIICHRSGHAARTCSEATQTDGKPVIAKFVPGQGKSVRLIKITEPSYQFCFGFNARGSCSNNSFCSYKHSCTYCGSGSHPACNCQKYA